MEGYFRFNEAQKVSTMSSINWAVMFIESASETSRIRIAISRKTHSSCALRAIFRHPELTTNIMKYKLFQAQQAIDVFALQKINADFK